MKVISPLSGVTQAVGLALAGYWMNMAPTDMTFPKTTINLLIEECTNLCGVNNSKTFWLKRRAAEVYYKVWFPCLWYAGPTALDDHRYLQPCALRLVKLRRRKQP
jgi:hypothetical protein